MAQVQSLNLHLREMLGKDLDIRLAFAIAIQRAATRIPLICPRRVVRLEC
jgi:hypothetical protein